MKYIQYEDTRQEKSDDGWLRIAASYPLSPNASAHFVGKMCQADWAVMQLLLQARPPLPTAVISCEPSRLAPTCYRVCLQIVSQSQPTVATCEYGLSVLCLREERAGLLDWMMSYPSIVENAHWRESGEITTHDGLGSLWLRKGMDGRHPNFVSAGAMWMLVITPESYLAVTEPDDAIAAESAQ